MTKKECKIIDILNVVNNIYKIERNNKDLIQTIKEGILTMYTELKPNIKNVLVLDNIIE